MSGVPDAPADPTPAATPAAVEAAAVDAADVGVAAGVAALYRLVWQSARGVRARFCLALALQAIGFSCAVAPPFLVGRAVDVAQASQGRDLSGMLGWLGLIPVAVVVTWAFNAPGRILERQVAVDVQRTLLSDLADQALTVPVRWHESRHSGETTSQIDGTVRAVVSFAESQSFYLKSVFNLLGAAVVLTFISWPVALLAVVGFGSLTWFMFSLDGPLGTRLDAHNTAGNELTATLADTLGNITTIKALGAGRQAHGAVMASMAAVERLARAIVVPMERKWWIITYGSGLLTACLLAGYTYLSWRQTGVVHAGQLVMISGYAATLQTAFEVMGGHWQALLRFQAEGRSADELRRTAAEAADAGAVPAGWQELVVRELRLTHPAREHGTGGAPRQPFSVELTDLPIRRGERIALVGSSGSGKSTVLRALAGLYPCDRFAVQAGGEPVPGVGSLSSIAGLLPQDVEIFESSLRHNVDLGTGADPAQLEFAAEQARLHEVLAHLPGGWDTHLVERGGNLSGGQKQRVGLARGLLLTRDRSLLLLDEPTSSLDALVESAIYANVTGALPDVAIVSAVHRLHLLRYFDTVILMRDGRVVDRGTPAQVIERQAELRSMVSASAAPAREADDRPGDPALPARRREAEPASR